MMIDRCMWMWMKLKSAYDEKLDYDMMSCRMYDDVESIHLITFL